MNHHVFQDQVQQEAYFETRMSNGGGKPEEESKISNHNHGFVRWRARTTGPLQGRIHSSAQKEMGGTVKRQTLASDE